MIIQKLSDGTYRRKPLKDADTNKTTLVEMHRDGKVKKVVVPLVQGNYVSAAVKHILKAGKGSTLLGVMYGTKSMSSMETVKGISSADRTLATRLSNKARSLLDS